MGFEPTRAEPIGLAVQRLNHSATSSYEDMTKNSKHHDSVPGNEIIGNLKPYSKRFDLL